MDGRRVVVHAAQAAEVRHLINIRRCVGAAVVCRSMSPEAKFTVPKLERETALVDRRPAQRRGVFRIIPNRMS